MRKRHLFVALLPLVSLLLACAGGGGGTGGGEKSGTLVVSGSRWVLSRDMGSGAAWVQHIEYTEGNALAVAHVPSNQLYMARFTTANTPFHIDLHDLRTFQLLREQDLVWPDSNDLSRMHGLAVSPSGRYVAAVVTLLDTRRLQVIDTSTEPPTLVLEGFSGVTGADLLWLSDDQLMFAMDLTGVSEAQGSGGVVMIKPAEADPNTGVVPLAALIEYSADEWVDVDRTSGFTLSPDGTQVAFSHVGDIWVFEPAGTTRDPHRLTTGPHGHVGPAFSPDGNSIAFVEYHREYQSHLFVVPNHREAPLQINGDSTEGKRYQVAGVAARRVISWHP